MNDADYPAIYQAASDLSQKSQNAFYRALAGHMALLVIAAAISVVNSPCAEIAILQSLVLLGALAWAIYLFLARPDRYWYAGRAVAESIKTVTWRYISRAEPFDHDDQIDRSAFALKVRAVIDQNRDVAGKLTTHLDGVQITVEMERLRAQDEKGRRNFYRDARIVDQQKWYAKKAAYNKRMVNIFFGWLIFVLCLAIAFAIAKVKYPSAPYWPTDIFVTLAASILSWIQAKRYQELSASYALTAHEISLIRQQASGEMDERALSLFVGDAENAFSREHTQWVARRDG